MQINEKTPLELKLDITVQNRSIVRLKKVLYAGFIPQHGMELMDTEIFFRVKTMAMAGLQTLKHTAFPLRRGKFIEGNRKIISKLFLKDEASVRESVEYFVKQGWEIER